MASFESGLNKLEGAHGRAEAAAKTHSRELTNIEGQLTKLAERTEFVALGFEHFRAIMGAGIGGAGIFGLEQLITGAVTYDQTVSKLTNTLQGNAEAGSTWAVIADHMKINVDTLERGFAKLGGEINADKPVLQQMGIATETSSGQLRDMNSVLLDAADYFHAHAGEVNNGALAQQLFGKSGLEMLPALQMGRDGIAQITEEARKYGLILDNEALQKSRQFSAELQQGEMAVKGLALGIGNALLPGIAYLAQGLAQIVEKNLPAFIAAIQSAVSYVIGFFEGITGTTAAVDQSAVSMANLQQVSGGAGSAMDNAAGGAKNMASAERALRDQAKDATDAIDAQIRTLDDQAKQFERAANDQIKALEGQGKQTTFDDRQTKFTQQEADKQRQIEKLKGDYVMDVYLGMFDQAASVQDQITKATEEAAQLQKDQAKSVADDQRQKKIDALKDTIQVKRDETAAAKSALEDQKRAIQDAANTQIQAMQDAASKTNSALIGGFAGVPAAGGAAGLAAGTAFAKDFGAEGKGKQLGDDIRRGIESGDWRKTADKVADDLMNTLGEKVNKKFGQFWQDLIINAANNYPGNPAGVGRTIGGWIDQFNDFMPHASGGMASGNILVGEKGPEFLSLPPGVTGNVTSNDDLTGLIQQLINAQHATVRAIYETAPAAASLADFAVASSAASVQRMRGVMGTSFP